MYLRTHTGIAIFDKALRWCFNRESHTRWKRFSHRKLPENYRRTFHIYVHCNTLCFARVSLLLIDHSLFPVSFFHDQLISYFLKNWPKWVPEVILSTRVGSFILCEKLCLTLYENIWLVLVRYALGTTIGQFPVGVDYVSSVCEISNLAHFFWYFWQMTTITLSIDIIPKWLYLYNEYPRLMQMYRRIIGIIIIHWLNIYKR